MLIKLKSAVRFEFLIVVILKI